MKAILRTLVGFIFPLALLGTMPSFGNDGDTLIFPYERATYVEGNSSISFRLRNATTKVPYLVQTSVEALDENSGLDTLNGKKDFPFMVTPPLYKLEPGKTYSWRVMFIGDSEKLPKDRETIFVAKFRAIPPSQPDEQKGANGISLDTIQVLYFKFYYRPKAFEKLIIAEEEKKISFRRDGNEIVVKNNSPIYMTFESLNVGGVVVEYQELFKPLKPLSEQRFKVNGVIANDKVSWSVLDELILELPKQTSVLH